MADKEGKTGHVWNVVKGLVSLGLLAWMGWSGQLDFGALAGARNPGFHVLGLAALLAGMLVQAVRWWRLLVVQALDVPLWLSIKVSWISQFLTLVLPGAISGEAVRGYYVLRHAPNAKLAGASSVVVDRALGLYSLLWLGVPAVALLARSPEGISTPVMNLMIVLGGLFLITTGFFVFLLVPGIWRAVRRWTPGGVRDSIDGVVTAYAARSGELAWCFALSLAAAVAFVFSFIIAGSALGIDVSWEQAFLVVPLVFVASTIPITPGGAGTAELTASYLFGLFGVPGGATITLLVRVWMVLLRLPGAAAYITYKKNVE